MMAAETPLTGVAWAAAPEAAPAGWTAVGAGGGGGTMATPPPGSPRILTLPVPVDHRYRGGRGGQPGQGLRAQGRRVPLRLHRRSPGAGWWWGNRDRGGGGQNRVRYRGPILSRRLPGP